MRRSLELSFVSCGKAASKIEKRKNKWGKKRERKKKEKVELTSDKQTERREENIDDLGKTKAM